jgi:hypothetical protein
MEWAGCSDHLLCSWRWLGPGLVYKYNDREFGSRGSTFFSDSATAMLSTKRLMVIGTCLAGLYFIWQLVRGL